MYTHVAHACSSHIEYYITTGHVCWNFYWKRGQCEESSFNIKPTIFIWTKNKQPPPPKKIQREEMNPTKLKSSKKNFHFQNLLINFHLFHNYLLNFFLNRRLNGKTSTENKVCFYKVTVIIKASTCIHTGQTHTKYKPDGCILTVIMMNIVQQCVMAMIYVQWHVRACVCACVCVMFGVWYTLRVALANSVQTSCCVNKTIKYLDAHFLITCSFEPKSRP